MIERKEPVGDPALAAGLGATVTEAPGYPSPASEAQKPATGFASSDPAALASGAQVRVSGNFRTGAKHQDLLTIGSAESGTFTSSGGEAIAFGFDRSTGILTLSGTASAGAYDEAFEAVRFALAGDDPDDGGSAASRAITYSTFDGAAYADLLEATVAVVAVNDSPTLEILGTQAARLGGETVVTTSAGSDREVSMTGLADGGYLMTWTHGATMGGDPSVIQAQRFDQTGTAVGAAITLAGSAGSTIRNSASAGFADGGFVIAWEGSGGLQAQRYSASGVKLGSQIVVSAGNNNSELHPTIAVLAGGGFVVAWDYMYQDGSGEAILARRFDSSGVAQGAAVRVNTFTANDQHIPAAAGLADGGYVIVWTSWQQDGPGAGVYGQRFNSAGVAQGGEFRINATADYTQENASVAALAGGGFVVAWSSLPDGWYNPSHIYAQRFDSAGNAVGGETRVSSVNGGDKPAVAGLADGGFAIVWQSEEIFSRRFDSAGRALGPEAQVNTNAAGLQWHPAVAALTGGDFVVGWADLNQGSGHTGVFRQRFTDGFAVEEGFAVILNGRISLDDVDSGTGAITVTLSVDHGDLFYLARETNAAVATGDGTTTVRITGSLADVKAFLGPDSILGYQNDSDAPPANAILTVRIEDSGGNGGAPLAAETSIVIGIVPVNDKPVLSPPASATLAFTEGDGPLALMQGVTVSDPDLAASFRTGGFDLTVTGSTGALQLRQGSAFTLAVDMYGNQVVSYQNGGAPVVAAYLVGLGTRSISVSDFRAVMIPALASDLIDDFVFVDSSDNPVAGNRTAALSFFDGRNLGLGITPRATAIQTIAVTPVNDAPVTGGGFGSGYEDYGRAWVTLDGRDPEGSPMTYTLTSLPANGLLYTASTGGTLVQAGAVFAASPSGSVSLYFQPKPDWSGSTSFGYTLSDGSLVTGPATATIAITPSNDGPRFSTPATVSAAEQAPVVLLGGVTVTDQELDPRNGGAGDYSGAILTVGGGVPPRLTDQFGLADGPSFTVDGNQLRTGGLAFASITGNSNGTLTIAFTGAQTPATRALVNEVLQAVRYTNASDSPSASQSVYVSLNDGGSTNGQGYPGNAYGSTSVTVNTSPVNDAPAIDLNGPAAGSVFVSYDENSPGSLIAPSATVADPDSGNFDQGQLLVTMGNSVQPYDRFAVSIQGNGPGQIGFNANGITYGGVLFAVRSGNVAAGELRFVFNANATPAAVQALVRRIAYFAETDVPVAGNRPVGFLISDGDGGTSLMATAFLTIAASDDPAVARNDSTSTAENSVATGNVFSDSGSGPDGDVDGPALAVAAVNGDSGKVGQSVTLGSGARLTLNADGSYAYDPNGRFDRLTGGSSGAVNNSATDSFAYSLAGGGSATVTVIVTGVAGAGDWLGGDGGGNVVSGTSGADFFHLVQGGDDTADGGGGNDVFLFGAALTSADQVDGGSGTDQVAIQGDYWGAKALTLGSNLVGVENLAILPGNEIRFGDPGTSFYDYSITLLDSVAAAGVQLVVDANRLRVGEDFTFDGSAESDGSFFVYGGAGVDLLTGGAKNDVFLFGAWDQFGAGDVVVGGSGIDQLALRGNYSLTFGAGQLVGIENIGLLSAHDTRFGALGSSYSYDLTMVDANVAAGLQMVVDGAKLRIAEFFRFDGSAELDGSFRVFGGLVDDIIIASRNNDFIQGNGGADSLTGGAGADIFRYLSASDSTSSAMDRILDFAAGGDKIDLSRIDANSSAAGDQGFNWIGSNAFSGSAGQLRAYQDGANWFVEGDIDGNGTADLVIQLSVTGGPLTQADFLP